MNPDRHEHMEAITELVLAAAFGFLAWTVVVAWSALVAVAWWMLA